MKNVAVALLLSAIAVGVAHAGETNDLKGALVASRTNAIAQWQTRVAALDKAYASLAANFATTSKTLAQAEAEERKEAPRTKIVAGNDMARQGGFWFGSNHAERVPVEPETRAYKEARERRNGLFSKQQELRKEIADNRTQRANCVREMNQLKLGLSMMKPAVTTTNQP